MPLSSYWWKAVKNIMPSNKGYTQNFSANNKYLILALIRPLHILTITQYVYTIQYITEINSRLCNIYYKWIWSYLEKFVPCRQIEPFTFAIMILQKLVQFMQYASSRQTFFSNLVIWNKSSRSLTDELPLQVQTNYTSILM